MKRLLLCVFMLSMPYCLAQSATQLKECKAALAKDPNSGLTSDICSVIGGQIASNEQIQTINDDGTFLTISPKPDGTYKLNTHSVPPEIQSTLLLHSITKTILDAETFVNTSPRSLAALMLPDWRNFWTQVRNAYCSYHPGEAYTGLSGKEEICANAHAMANSKPFPPSLLNGASIIRYNLLSSKADASVGN